MMRFKVLWLRSGVPFTCRVMLPLAPHAVVLPAVFQQLDVPPPADAVMPVVTVGVTIVGLVARTTLPVPVSGVAANCEEELLPSTVADAGTAPPFTFATVGLG